MLGIPFHSIIELYDLQCRPAGLPEDTYPLIVHKFEDIPTGSDEQLVVLDVVVHNEQAPSVTDRRTVRLTRTLYRSSLLIAARIDRYCHQVQDRCLVLYNGENWPARDIRGKRLSHGAYIQIRVPPWTDETMSTVQAIWQAQTGQTIHNAADEPLPSRGSSSHDVWSEPADRNEEPDVKHDMHGADSEVSDIDDDAGPWNMPDAQLVPADDFIENLLTNWRDEAALETEELGPSGYYAVWYVSSELMHRCDRPRHIGLLADHATWMRRIASLWQDVIDRRQPLYFHFVRPEPPASVHDTHLAGHIILAQHLRPHECATHMTVIAQT